MSNHFCPVQFCHIHELKDYLKYGTHRVDVLKFDTPECLFVCGEVLRPIQPNEVMSSAVSLPNCTFTGQA